LRKVVSAESTTRMISALSSRVSMISSPGNVGNVRTKEVQGRP
jgi:hypothetical protein